MAWAKQDTVTATSGDDVIDMNRTGNKKFNIIIASLHRTGSSNIGGDWQLNNDSGTSKHAQRYSINGATDVTSTTSTGITFGSSQPDDFFQVGYIFSNGTDEMLVMGWTVYQGTWGSSGLGAGTAPNRMESTGKFVTAGDLTQVEINQTSSAGFSTDSNGSWLGSD